MFKTAESAPFYFFFAQDLFAWISFVSLDSIYCSLLVFSGDLKTIYTAYIPLLGVLLPNLVALGVRSLHREQHRSLLGVFKHSQLVDVYIELGGLVHISERHRHKGCGITAVLHPLHKRLWVPSVNLELVGGRGLKVQRLQRDTQTGEELRRKGE